MLRYFVLRQYIPQAFFLSLVPRMSYATRAPSCHALLEATPIQLLTNPYDVEEVIRHHDRQELYVRVLLCLFNLFNNMVSCAWETLQRVCLKDKHAGSGFSELRDLADRHGLEAVVAFVKKFPSVFHVESESFCRRELSSSVSENELGAALETYVPLYGSTRTEGICAVLCTSEAVVTQALASSQQLSKVFSHGSSSAGHEHKKHICRISWTESNAGAFPEGKKGGFHSELVPALRIAVHSVSPKIPPYWVPLEEVFANVALESKIDISAAPRIFAFYRTKDIERGTAFNKEFARRTGPCEGLPPNDTSYPSYQISPDKLKLFVRVVQNQTSRGPLDERIILGRLPPVLSKWFRTCISFTPAEVAMLYCQLLTRHEPGRLSVPPEVAALKDEELIERCKESPDGVEPFQRVLGFHRQDQINKRKKIKDYETSGTALTDEEMIDICNSIIDPVETITFEEFKRRLNEKYRGGKYNPTLNAFIAACFTRYGTSIRKFLTTHYNASQDAVTLTWVFSRAEGVRPIGPDTTHNPYLDPLVLVQCIKDALERSPRDLSIDKMNRVLPEAACQAMTALGGHRKFLLGNFTEFDYREDLGFWDDMGPKIFLRCGLRPPRSTIRNRVMAMYYHYNSSRMGSVDMLLEQYEDREADLLQTLIAKYGPEPVDEK